MPKKTKTCAWISRHAPSKKQRSELEAAGYRIYQVNPPDRIKSAGWAWALAQNACGGIPDLCVVVLPLNILKYFIRTAGDQTTIVQAPAIKSGEYAHDWEWSGLWQRIKSVRVVTEPWTPGGER